MLKSETYATVVTSSSNVVHNFLDLYKFFDVCFFSEKQTTICEPEAEMDKIWLVFGNHSDAHLIASLAASKQYGDPHALAQTDKCRGQNFLFS
jgi:hypothetical protein